METTANAALIEACRHKQSAFVEEDENNAFCEALYQDFLAETRQEEERRLFGDDDLFEHEEYPRRAPLTEARKAALRAQGKETPDEYKERKAHVAREKVQRAVRAEEENEKRKAQDELPVVAKPTLEFRLALQQARHPRCTAAWSASRRTPRSRRRPRRHVRCRRPDRAAGRWR
jgi:hypothetical protein